MGAAVSPASGCTGNIYAPACAAWHQYTTEAQTTPNSVGRNFCELTGYHEATISRIVSTDVCWASETPVAQVARY